MPSFSSLRGPAGPGSHPLCLMWTRNRCVGSPLEMRKLHAGVASCVAEGKSTRSKANHFPLISSIAWAGGNHRCSASDICLYNGRYMMNQYLWGSSSQASLGEHAHLPLGRRGGLRLGLSTSRADRLRTPASTSAAVLNPYRASDPWQWSPGNRMPASKPLQRMACAGPTWLAESSSEYGEESSRYSP